MGFIFLFILNSNGATACDSYVVGRVAEVEDEKPLYNTIQVGIDASINGCEICVRAGTYSAFVVDGYQSGSPLLITAVGDGQTPATVSLEGYSGTGALIRDSSYVLIRGLVFTGGLYNKESRPYSLY